MRIVAAICLLCLTFPLVALSVPDPEFVQSVIARQFYKADIKLEHGETVEQLVQQLHDQRHDPWADIISSADTSQQLSIRKEGYGLRVLRFSPSVHYLLPELGGPNATGEFTVLRVRQAPLDGDWTTAIENSQLQLEDDSLEFNHSTYLARSFDVTGGTVRIDDFINPSLPSSIARQKDALADVTVIDLRFNGGGRVDIATQFAKALVGTEVPLGGVHRRGEFTLSGAAQKDLSADDLRGIKQRLQKTTVLVSRFTASSAEWLARNLQVHGATLIGERSAGKCLVHRAIAIGAGRSIKLAVGKLQSYLPEPDKELLYRYCDFGLVPDYWVDGHVLIERSAIWLANLPVSENTAD